MILESKTVDSKNNITIIKEREKLTINCKNDRYLSRLAITNKQRLTSADLSIFGILTLKGGVIKETLMIDRWLDNDYLDRREGQLDVFSSGWLQIFIGHWHKCSPLCLSNISRSVHEQLSAIFDFPRPQSTLESERETGRAFEQGL